ncbi:MAG: hypothetical protein GW859_09455 [Sphingomonadales bacterium]|nr:hypothetical protein [Sphingomonadales bacterium]
MTTAMPSEPDPPPRLLFVYNADSGFASALVDTLHKLVAPASYTCSLCALTHGPLTMRRRWRDWLGEASFEARFVHRDELARLYPGVTPALPCVLIESETGPVDFLPAQALASMTTLDELIESIESELAASGPAR